MTVLSQLYPGITVQCACGALLAIDPHKDLYEDKYVYCPICKVKIELPIKESTWKQGVNE